MATNQGEIASFHFEISSGISCDLGNRVSPITCKRVRNSIPELQKVATHTGIPVVHIAGSIINRTKTIGRAIKDAGPLMFFELFLNAEFIFTNSFHGTAVALNFGRPLVGIRHLTRNARMRPLLKFVSWPDSLVGDETPVTEIEEIARKSATAVDDSVLSAIRSSSIEFLKRNLD